MWTAGAEVPPPPWSVLFPKTWHIIGAFINEHVYRYPQPTSVHAFLSLAGSGKGNNVFLITKRNSCQRELAPSRLPGDLCPHSDASSRCRWGRIFFFFSFQVQLKLLVRSKTTWKWNVKSGGGHVCVISFISIRVRWLFSPLGHRLA